MITVASVRDLWYNNRIYMFIPSQGDTIMAKYRRDRINEEMTHEVSDIVRNIKDPRVSKHLVSVMRCEVTPDLKYCKIFYSVLGANKEGDGFDAK